MVGPFNWISQVVSVSAFNVRTLPQRNRPSERVVPGQHFDRFVVTNNTQYKILKDCARVLNLPEAAAGRFESLDIVSPTIDFVALAQSLGVSACRLSEPDDLSQRVSESLAGNEPRLIEVAVRHPSE